MRTRDYLFCLSPRMCWRFRVPLQAINAERNTKQEHAKQTNPPAIKQITSHWTRTTNCRARSLVSNLLGRARPEGYSAYPAGRFQQQFRMRSSCAAVRERMLPAKVVGMFRTYVNGYWFGTWALQIPEMLYHRHPNIERDNKQERREREGCSDRNHTFVQLGRCH